MSTALLELKKLSLMLKPVKTRKLLAVLNKLGFKRLRQKGSHVFLTNSIGRTTVIPLHDEIRPKLLTKILKDTGVNKKEFLKHLK